MRRVWFAGLLAIGLIGGLPSAVAAFTAQQATTGQETARSRAVAHEAEPQDSDDDGDGDGDGNGDGGGLGPPPWAHAGQTAARGQGKDSAWKQAWHDLTPAQRQKKMKALAKSHADGMAEWGRCVAASAGDQQSLAGCDKPLPPGLAKRQP